MGPARKKHGFPPKIAAASKGSTGARLALSFCERVNSVANQAASKGITLLAPDEAGALATLRMSRELVELMRESRAHLSFRHFQDFADDKDEEESLNLSIS